MQGRPIGCLLKLKYSPAIKKDKVELNLAALRSKCMPGTHYSRPQSSKICININSIWSYYHIT